MTLEIIRNPYKLGILFELFLKEYIMNIRLHMVNCWCYIMMQLDHYEPSLSCGQNYHRIKDANIIK